MTPKEQYRIQRRSLRFDLAKCIKAMSKIDSLGSRWRRLPAIKPVRQFPGAKFLRQMREVERHLRNTWASTPGFKYLPPEHPVRLAAQERAKAHQPHFLDDFIWRSGDATLPPPVEYVKPQPLRKSKVVEKVDPYYVPPQLWLPEEVVEAETGSSRDDPLVILLEREGAYHEAYELRQSHRAGTTQTVLKFYMEQRPDRYPQTLPGTVWVSQRDGDTTEVQPYVRTRRVKAA